MELSQILNPNSDLDIFCLQFFAFNLIQGGLDWFQLYWNNHRRRTEGHKSLSQLLDAGLAGLGEHGYFYRISAATSIIDIFMCVYYKLDLFIVVAVTSGTLMELR